MCTHAHTTVQVTSALSCNSSETHIEKQYTYSVFHLIRYVVIKWSYRRWTKPFLFDCFSCCCHCCLLTHGLRVCVLLLWHYEVSFGSRKAFNPAQCGFIINNSISCNSKKRGKVKVTLLSNARVCNVIWRSRIRTHTVYASSRTQFTHIYLPFVDKYRISM